MRKARWLRTKNEPANVDEAHSSLTDEASAMPPHRFAVGGLWETIGPLQLEFLVGRGLKPHHRLLDIGCGALRGGVHFIDYLDAGGYYGIDAEEWLIQAGREQELSPGLEEAKRPTFIVRDDFDFSGFGTTFDFAIAQSVFTHLPFNSIHRALVNVASVLSPGGAFYATYFENTRGAAWLDPIAQWSGGEETTHEGVSRMDADPFHYEFEALDWLAGRVGLGATNIGDWGHPRNQHMAMFERAG